MSIKPHVYNFLIKERREVAHGTTEVALDIGNNGFTFYPGQYIRVTIPSLSIEIEGGNTRDFTISSSPSTKEVICISFRDSDSPFKQTLLKLPLGSNVEVQGPLGVFTLPDENTIPIIFIAGGMGITPVLSMIRYIIEKDIEQHIQVIYGYQSEKEAAYIEELREVQKRNLF